MKTILKRMLNRIKNWLINGFDLKKSLMSCGISFLSFLLVFPAGALSSKTIDEVCADYFADVSKNHTNDIGNKKLSGLVVEPKSNSSAKVRQDTDNAITELWGVFKGENASFAPVMNSNKQNEIYFSDSKYSSESLSLVYTNVGQSTESYHIDKETDEPIDYKFQSSPLALMFPSGNSGMQDQCHIYISQSQAERKLIADEKEVNKENLKSLQGKKTQLIIDGAPYDCIIDNIYLDNFKHLVEQPKNPKTNKPFDYYYASDIGTIIGDFVFVILYANKQGVFPENLTRQSLYVMSEYSFRNKFYLQYAKESYSSNDFSFEFVKTNLKDNFTPDNEILQRTLRSSSSNVLCVIITILFAATFAFNLFFIYRQKLFIQPLSLLLIWLSSIFPYLIFKIIFSITNNTFIFSSYSLISNLILLVSIAIIVLVLNCFGRARIKENTNG